MCKVREECDLLVEELEFLFLENSLQAVRRGA